MSAGEVTLVACAHQVDRDAILAKYSEVPASVTLRAAGHHAAQARMALLDEAEGSVREHVEALHRLACELAVLVASW